MPQQPISNVKALTALHFSLLIGQLMFASIGAYLIYSKRLVPLFSGQELGDMMDGGVVVASLVIILTAFALYRRKIEKIKITDAAVSVKLTAYRVTSLTFWAMLEVPTLLTITVFILTGSNFLWISVAFMLLLFYYVKPTTAKVAGQLGVEEAEVQ